MCSLLKRLIRKPRPWLRHATCRIQSSAINLANSNLAKAVWDSDMTTAFLSTTVRFGGWRLERSRIQHVFTTTGIRIGVGGAAAKSYVSRCRWIAGSMVLLVSFAGVALILLVRKINGALRTTVIQLADVSVQIAAAARPSGCLQPIAGAEGGGADGDDRRNFEREHGDQLDGTEDHGKFSLLSGDGHPFPEGI